MQNYANKLDNLDKVNNSLRKCKLSKLAPDIENLISKKTSKIIPMLYKLYQSIEKNQKLPNSFYTVGKTFKPKLDKGSTHVKKVIGHSLIGTYM